MIWYLLIYCRDLVYALLGAGYTVSVQLLFLSLVLEPEVCRTGGQNRRWK